MTRTLTREHRLSLECLSIPRARIPVNQLYTSPNALSLNVADRKYPLHDTNIVSGLDQRERRA
jgi:hypothetical protein